MTSVRIDDSVKRAIELAKAAGWKVSVQNQLVKITPPSTPGHAAYQPLTTPYSLAFSDDTTKREWAQTCRRFGLVDGPATTPAERELAEKAAERPQDREALTQKEVEKARVAAIQAAETAKSRTAPPGLLFQAPAVAPAPVPAAIAPAPKPTALAAVPKTTPQENPVPKVVASSEPSDEKLYPAFTEDMIGWGYPQFAMADGRLFCPECLRDGKKSSFKKGQGLAAHRGWLHGLYATPVTDNTEGLSMRTELPQNVLAAFDLAIESVVDALAGASDPTEIARLTKELADVRKELATAKAESSSRGTALNEAQERLRSADTVKAAAVQAQKSLSEGMLNSFEELLKKIALYAQTLAPVQAVAKIDTDIKEYLKEG